MTSDERAHKLVSAMLEITGVDVSHDKRSQLDAFVIGHLNEIERLAAERAVAVYRDKASEASSAVLSQTAIGTPILDP